MVSSRSLSPRVNRLFNLHLGHILWPFCFIFVPFCKFILFPLSISPAFYAGLQRSFLRDSIPR